MLFLIKTFNFVMILYSKALKIFCLSTIHFTEIILSTLHFTEILNIIISKVKTISLQAFVGRQKYKNLVCRQPKFLSDPDTKYVAFE